MPDSKGRLFIADIATKVGISASDWRARVSRGYAPKPDDLVRHEGSLRLVWNADTIEAYLKARAERLGEAGR